MSTRLQLVEASAMAIHQHAPRVLTEAFQARLAQLNQAERALRCLGFRVQWSQLEDPAPHVRVERTKEQSIASLLDQMGPRSFQKGVGYTLISGRFQGVTVSWMEPA